MGDGTHNSILKDEPVTPVGKDISDHLKVTRRFVEVYCKHHHPPAQGSVCEQCQNLIDYARTRLERCPYDPKPKCKDCRTHCYKPNYREHMKAVMRFSGMYFVKRGRLDWLVRYFVLNRPRGTSRP